jgi:hypothetical protein
MMREVESEQCSAMIMFGTVQVGSVLPCWRIGKGYCYKDKLNEGAQQDETVAVAAGACLADEQAGIQDPSSAAELLQKIQDNPGSVGARVALDQFIERPPSE